MAMTPYQWQPSDAPYPKKPAPSPKGSITYPQPSRQLDPNVRSFSGMSKMDPNINPKTGRRFFDNPVAGNIESAIRTYQSMDQPQAQPQNNWGVIYDGGPQAQPGQDSWRDRVYHERDLYGQRGGGSSYQDQNANAARAAAIPVPDMPEYKPGEYKPPGEDPSVYGSERDKAMAPGMRALREGTSEAINQAQSLDNPNARAKFIQSALKGYGQGLENVAAGAHKQATAVAGQKRAEQLDMYKTNFIAKSDAYLINYKNQVNKIAQEYANQQTMAQAGQAPSMGSDRLQRIYAQQSASRGSIPGYSGR